MVVSFPGLDIELIVSRVAFTVFGIPIYYYGLIIAIGFLAGIFFASMVAKKLGEKSDLALDLALICSVPAIICARLYYVIFRFDDYKDNILSIFDIRSGGIAIYGAVIGAVVAAYVFCRIKNINTLKVFDIGSVGLITGQAIGRWGNFFNQEAFGSNTNLPWGMTSDAVKEYLTALKLKGVNVSPDIPVHPTFLYESIWCIITLVVLIFIVYKFYKFNGQVFYAYGALYGLGRLWIEGLRTDSLMIGSVRVSQAVALVSVVVFAALYITCIKKSKRSENI